MANFITKINYYKFNFNLAFMVSALQALWQRKMIELYSN